MTDIIVSQQQHVFAVKFDDEIWENEIRFLSTFQASPSLPDSMSKDTDLPGPYRSLTKVGTINSQNLRGMAEAYLKK